MTDIICLGIIFGEVSVFCQQQFFCSYATLLFVGSFPYHSTVLVLVLTILQSWFLSLPFYSLGSCLYHSPVC